MLDDLPRGMGPDSSVPFFRIVVRPGPFNLVGCGYALVCDSLD